MSPSRRGKVTLSDIAEACGVSRATVSLVLRRSPLVHRDTRKRVEEEMARQGYIYNRAAANLRSRTSSAVALVINDLSNPFFAEFAAGVDEALGGAGYVTLLGCSNESAERQLAILRSLMEHDPAAVILSPAEVSDATSVVDTLGPRTPLVVFNRRLAGEIPSGRNVQFVGLDNRGGARLATEYLQSLGHTHIAFFGGHLASSSCKERREGYLEAMRAQGIEPAQHWLVESAPTRLDAWEHVDTLFAGATHPTAAVCYNDAVALGLMPALVHRGLVPGRDFAVVGFDDIPEASMCAPSLTTLSADPRARGRQTAELVLRQVQGARHAASESAASAIPGEECIVPVHLAVRDSTCRVSP